MKKLPIVLVFAAAVLAGCSTGASNNTTNNSSGNNSPSNPANLPASGASTAPTSLNAIFTAFNSIPSTDPVLTDLQSSLSSLGNGLTTPTPNTVASAVVKNLRSFKGSSKSLSSDITTQVNNLITAFNNFTTAPVANPITASNGTATVSGDMLGTYFKLTTATAALTASVTTSGGQALASDSSNFLSAKGSAALDLKIDLVNPPASSALKYLTIQANIGGSATLTPATAGTPGPASNVAFTYNAQSYLVAASFDNNGTGGKIVLTVSLPAYSNTVSTSSTASASTFASTPTIVLTVYDDSGTSKYTKTWTDLGQFQTDISSL